MKEKGLSEYEDPMDADGDEHGPEGIAGTAEGSAEDKRSGVGHDVDGGHAEHKDCFGTGCVEDGL